MDDSPGLDVLALLGGGALRASLGCDGAGGVGLTQVWYLLWAGATEEEPSASTTTMTWRAAGAREAAMTTEGRAAGTLGPAAAAAAAEAPAAKEASTVGELGPTATTAPEVEVSVGGVGP